MNNNLKIVRVPISDIKASKKNPRKWSEDATVQLKESITRFGIVEPLVLNSAQGYKNVLLGGNFRAKVLKDLGYTEVDAVYVNIPDEAKQEELNIRLNKNTGEFDFDLLAEFNESLLADIGFTSKEIDDIFDVTVNEPDSFDMEKELAKLNITEITVQKGDVYQLGDSKLMCGDSTVATDMDKLMAGELADMCMTDPPYILDYLGAQRHGKAVTGFGAKRNRRYLETDVMPDNFTELWMANVAKYAKPDYSIICYENWKNVPVISAEMSKHWKIKNMLVWHLPNRHQNFASKYKFFSKYDIAMVGASGTVEYNHDEEADGLQEEYETALYAISGKPQWESYSSGKKYQPTDFIEYIASDEKHSGQGVIFGTKPLEILIPYIKVLTKRGDLVVEPFCGSGSTLIASTKLKRRCNIMEKSPTYAEVALARWEKLTGEKRVKL